MLCFHRNKMKSAHSLSSVSPSLQKAAHYLLSVCLAFHLLWAPTGLFLWRRPVCPWWAGFFLLPVLFLHGAALAYCFGILSGQACTSPASFFIGSLILIGSKSCIIKHGQIHFLFDCKPKYLQTSRMPWDIHFLYPQKQGSFFSYRPRHHLPHLVPRA